ncbi:helix-turn-helix domain-containing protein [Sinorhizobium meliloti]|uniref:helix-turn-helix domain-containing protein n=1 Tax=Rhizobium meliloti TaxID=382 RepID=UPI000FDCB3AA|nr:AraC family transcriptional regulator [Sinorhizobium meliloti]RVG74837.1 AraC family transcriptional regulator [Sinorhizobium meliloti]RVH36316.1 AraC family transcriptional regulator [Sinorhizobium meliloti]RVH54119.1 AraC family transcriptional regulator [Sinorhizobium meliloti]
MHAFIDGSRGFAFGEAIYPAGGVYGPLKDRYVTLLIIHEGQARVFCDDDETVLGPRSCGFFRNERHLFIEYGDGHAATRVSWCEGHAGELSEPVAMRLRSLPPRISLSQRIETIQRLGVELGAGSSSNLNMLRNSLGEAIFLAYFHEAQMSEQERLTPRSVLRARFYIDENYEKEITVARLASLVGVTPQHLVSSFRKHIGTTPVRYLWQVRAHRGHFLLLQTGLAISDIAYQCGYKNPFHFSRQISEQFGMSPREVRANKGYRMPSDISEGAADTAYGMALPGTDPIRRE